jgi:hypothetical protein
MGMAIPDTGTQGSAEVNASKIHVAGLAIGDKVAPGVRWGKGSLVENPPFMKRRNPLATGPCSRPEESSSREGSGLSKSKIDYGYDLRVALQKRGGSQRAAKHLPLHQYS